MDKLNFFKIRNVKEEELLSSNSKDYKNWRNKLNFYAFVVTVLGQGDMYPPDIFSKPFSIAQAVDGWKETVKFIKDGKAPRQLGVVIFVPFCKTRCLFCPYLSFPLSSRRQLDMFTDSLIEEMKFFQGVFRGVQFNTLWFVGGTPSILENRHFKKIFKTLNKLFTFTNNVQITMECAVSSLDYKKLKLFRSLNVNRITIGIQSLNNHVLKVNNRLFQDRDRSLQLIRETKKAGIEIINIDLMCGLPGDNISSFKKGLQEIIALKPEMIHINPFLLSHETNFFKKGFAYSEEDAFRRSAEAKIGTQLIENAGYRRADGAFLGFTRLDGVENQQEIDRIKYNSSYIGFGATVTSHAFAQLHYTNIGFERRWDRVTLPKYSGCRLDIREEMRKHMIMNMRRPISRKDFKEIFGKDIIKSFHPEFQELRRHNLVIVNEEEVIFKIKTRKEHVILAKCFFNPKILNSIQKKLNVRFDASKNYFEEINRSIDNSV